MFDFEVVPLVTRRKLLNAHFYGKTNNAIPTVFHLISLDMSPVALDHVTSVSYD